MNPTGRNVLIPLAVPWMISPSSGLRLEAAEEGDAIVRFAGLFLDGGPELVRRPLRVSFSPGACARILPAHPGGAIIDEAAFDTSRIPFRYKPGGDMQRLRKEKRSSWQATTLAPDP